MDIFISLVIIKINFRINFKTPPVFNNYLLLKSDIYCKIIIEKLSNKRYHKSSKLAL